MKCTFVLCVVIALGLLGEGLAEPDPWYISRDTWLARPADSEPQTRPSPLVIIQHTVTSACHDITACAAQMRTLQSYFIEHMYSDIAYNFVIGNDGRVYEGRGWGKIGGHTSGYNQCSIGIAFIGDYRYDEPTPQQRDSVTKLLAQGIELGHLGSNYTLAGARDLRRTISPGDNLYSEIQQWERYDKDRARGKTCVEIH